MKQIIIYSTTKLYLKGIDLLIKEGISLVQTNCTDTVPSLQKQLLSPEIALLILHLDFSAEIEEELIHTIALIPHQIPVLILTDDIAAANMFLPAAHKNIICLDVRNTATVIITQACQLSGLVKSDTTLA